MNQPSRFRIPNRWIFLLLTLAFFQLGVSTESNKIEGLVVDAETTTPLPDVNILAVSVRDTSGTTTDNGGRFILKFSGTRPSELIFSHIGYETLVYPIGSNPDIEIFLVRKSIQIPVISVVGAGSRSNLQVTSSVFKLDEATIEERGFRNLEQSLLSESSITIQRNTDGRETVSIRGSNSCEVGVFVDGVLMNAPFDGVADLSSVNIYDMTDLEVVKGGGSNLFGMGFFGGVINMKSKTPDRNGFGARYAGSTVFSSDRDQYQYINILLDDFSFSFRNLLRSQPLTPENLYSNQYQTAGMTARVPTGKIHFKWFGQVYQIESQNFNPFLMDSTSYFSAQYLGTIPYIGQDWQAQWTTRKDQNSDSFWETAGMNQHTSDVAQIITLMKGFDHSGFSTVFLAEQNSQYFKGSSEFHIDDIYDRQTIMDIDQLNSAGAITTKFITGDLASLVNQITMEAGLRFERSDIDLFKTDNHQISSGYSPSRIDTLQKSITRTLSSRKIGMNLEGRLPKMSYSVFTNMGKDMKAPLLRDVYNIETTPIIAYQGNTLLPEVLSNFEFGYQLDWYRDDALDSDISFSGNIFRNQYSNKTYYEYVVASPPIPVQTDEAKINGYNVRISWGIYNRLLNISYDETRLEINDARSFPAKPKYRQTADVLFTWKLLSLNYQHFIEGEQFLPGTELNYLSKRENAHFSASAKMRFSDLQVTLAYRIENLLSKKGELSDSFSIYLPANYFLRYNEYLSLQITYPAN